MSVDTRNPLIIQSDRAILLEVDNPRYVAARDALAAFAELEKSPEHIHTYRITPLSIWNACAAGHAAEAGFASSAFCYPKKEIIWFSTIQPKRT